MKTQMPFNNEIEKVKAEIEVLQKKLSFLEELSQTKTPCEEAYKKVFGFYPKGRENGVWTIADEDVWLGFKEGYNATQKDDHPYKIADEHGELNPYKQYLNSVEDEKKMEELGFVKNDEGYWTAQPLGETTQERGEKVHKEMEEKLQEKEWNIKVVTDYLTGKSRHKLNIVDKDGNDYKPEPITTEELLKPNWEPKPQTEKEVEEGLRSAMRQAMKDGVFDEKENDKNFKNSPDLIREWGEQNKSPTLKELLWEWWEDIFTVDSNLDVDASIDVLVSKIDKEFIPPYSNTNDYKWNKCLELLRNKLR